MGGDSGLCSWWLGRREIPEGKTLAFKAIVVSTVPIGGGVSSSASLCVATATFLDGVIENAGVVPPSPKVKLVASRLCIRGCSAMHWFYAKGEA